MLHSTLYLSTTRGGALCWRWNPFRVPDGKPQLKQASSTASERAEPKLHASIIININIASIIIFQPIWILSTHHHTKDYGSDSFSTVFASELA